MDNNIKQSVKQVLTEYLESNKLRKTPERLAILDAAYSIDGHFTLEELNAHLEKENFRVSRATLYNTLKLFIELRLVVIHRFPGKTFYEAGYANENHCYQVCATCGKFTEVQLPQVSNALKDSKFRRFHKERFILYIYGTCSSCRAKTMRNKKKKRI
ncbi:MAG: transcriptional repressor [Prevotella sp.]|nr:transcriptional repressor [Prevotella sp.]